MSELKQIVAERGVITFDGEVVDAIRAAAPNLKEGS
jgi:hypothetical protein